MVQQSDQTRAKAMDPCAQDAGSRHGFSRLARCKAQERLVKQCNRRQQFPRAIMRLRLAQARKAALVSCPPVWRDPIWADFECKHDGTPISRRSCFCQCPVILHTISMEDPCSPLDLALGSRPCPPLWELYILLVPFIKNLLRDLFYCVLIRRHACTRSFFLGLCPPGFC